MDFLLHRVVSQTMNHVTLTTVLTYRSFAWSLTTVGRVKIDCLIALGSERTCKLRTFGIIPRPPFSYGIQSTCSKEYWLNDLSCRSTCSSIHEALKPAAPLGRPRPATPCDIFTLLQLLPGPPSRGSSWDQNDPCEMNVLPAIGAMATATAVIGNLQISRIPSPLLALT